MDEARRFLRYVTPGLTFALELIVYLYISQPQWTTKVIYGLLSQGIAAALGAFLASGSIGYLLSVVYHWWSWQINVLVSAPDYRRVLSRAQRAGYVEFRYQSNLRRLPSTRVLSKEGAWVTLTAMWHERMQTSCHIKGANPRADSLADIMHGAGAALVGSILALIVWVAAWLYIHFGQLSSWPTTWAEILRAIVVAILVAIPIALLHLCNFIHTRQLSQGFVELVFFDQLHHEWLCRQKPVVFHIRGLHLK